jgi:dTDP-4-amino-4,6-dideoxygalactose transaminase
MLVTSSEGVADRSKLLRNYGQRENYASEIPGDNSRLDEIHAAILRLKLKSLDSWNRRRRAIAETYREGLRELPLGLQAETGQSNYHLFVVTTPQRDALRRYLAEREIPTIVHYPIPLPRQKAFEEFDPAECPNADRLCARVLSLPMHPSLRDFEVEAVIEGVRGFFGK